MVGILLSYWEGNFSGTMLNFGKVIYSTVSWCAMCCICDICVYFTVGLLSTCELEIQSALPAVKFTWVASSHCETPEPSERSKAKKDPNHRIFCPLNITRKNITQKGWWNMMNWQNSKPDVKQTKQKQSGLVFRKAGINHENSMLLGDSILHPTAEGLRAICWQVEDT